MKKQPIYFIVAFITTILLTTCERDDICIDETTPNFVIRFFDNDDPTEFKTVNQLSVKSIASVIEGDSLVFSSVDSIAIPVNTNINNTQYVVTINSNNQATSNRDTITITYAPQDVFVGRSCGFKSIFNNVTYTIKNDSDNWIKGIEVVTDIIENETQAHLKILH